MKIRIGTRGSDLALWQARHIAARLTAAGHESEIIVLETRGDRIDHIPLQQVEGKGFFTKELEDALLEERVDLAVHSHKDLPGAMLPALVIAAVPARAAAEERLLVAPDAHAPAGLFLPLKHGSRVGTSAPRRAEQLATLRPDLALTALRGNVPTRVRRLREGRYDAILLAAAGLDRLQLDLGGLIVLTLPRALFVPAPAQGALAIQTRANDTALREICAHVLADPDTAATVAAERELLQTLGGGCNLPLGVALEREGSCWRARAFLGAGYPRAECAARWCHALGADPAAAVTAVGEQLLAGHATAQGPLEHLRVALTGTAGAGEELARRLTTLGARVVREAVLEVEDLAAPELPQRLASLRPHDVLALTSANAARRLGGHVLPPGVRVAAVGRATARALEEAGLRAELVGHAGAAEFARALPCAAGTRVLFPCALDARSELEDELRPRGVVVERVPLYTTRAVRGATLSADVDVRLYQSPSAVRAALAWEHDHPSSTIRRLALGPSTAEALTAAGLAHERTPSTDSEDVLSALVRATIEPTHKEKR